ncbi:MAG: hypothetical protein R3C59_10275 [Planctomycetaceae bacterium]
MHPISMLADMPGPFIQFVFGGGFVIVCGAFLATAVFLFARVRRKREHAQIKKRIQEWAPRRKRIDDESENDNL